MQVVFLFLRDWDQFPSRFWNDWWLNSFSFFETAAFKSSGNKNLHSELHDDCCCHLTYSTINRCFLFWLADARRPNSCHVMIAEGQS